MIMMNKATDSAVGKIFGTVVILHIHEMLELHYIVIVQQRNSAFKVFTSILL